MYYANGLTHEDENKLRTAFWEQNSAQETSLNVARGAMFLAYLPLTYRLSAMVRPASLLVWTGAYYFGAYQGFVQPFLVSRMQSSLNFAA